MAEEEKALDAQATLEEKTPQEPPANEKPEDLKAQLEEARGRLKALEAAQQEAVQLKEALKQRDRKIQNLTQKPRDSGEIEELRTQIDALASALLTEEVEEDPRPLTRKERYEQALRAKQHPPKEVGGQEKAYATKMSQLLTRHGVDMTTPPEDLVATLEEANSYWADGAYGLALDTMKEALQERSQKQAQAKVEEEKKVVNKAERERLAQNLTRDTTPGEGGPPPNLKRLLEMPVHKMNKEELAAYDKKLDAALRK